MTALFFTVNHQNYSRRLTVYHDKLLKLKNYHADISEEFKNACFSLKQTSKPFSRIRIDLNANDSIIFHFQSSKLLTLVHRASRQVT